MEQTLREKHFCPTSGEVEFWMYSGGSWRRVLPVEAEDWHLGTYSYVEWHGEPSLPRTHHSNYPPRKLI